MPNLGWHGTILAVCLLLYVIMMVVMGIFGLIATIVTCRADWKTYGCLFHTWRQQRVFESGIYWYYECSGCHHRHALKVHKGYSPIDQNWLNGGRRADIAVYMPDGAEPTKWLTEGPINK